MGCSASSSLSVPRTSGTALSIEEYKTAYAALSRVRIVRQLQRRRPESVGLPAEDGVFWVYWRPPIGKDESHRLKAANSGASILTELRGWEWDRAPNGWLREWSLMEDWDFFEMFCSELTLAIFYRTNEAIFFIEYKKFFAWWHCLTKTSLETGSSL